MPHTSKATKAGSSVDLAAAAKIHDRTATVAVVFLCIVTILISTLMPVSLEPAFIICPSRLFFDAQCPGCGLTRGFAAVAHAQFAMAWKLNPFALLLYPVTWLSFAAGILRLQRNSPPLFKSTVQRLEAAGLIVMFAMIIHHAMR